MNTTEMLANAQDCLEHRTFLNSYNVIPVSVCTLPQLIEILELLEPVDLDGIDVEAMQKEVEGNINRMTANKLFVSMSQITLSDFRKLNIVFKWALANSRLLAKYMQAEHDRDEAVRETEQSDLPI
jgi:hypothetical protein